MLYEKTRLKVGDLVRFKISALQPDMTEWLKTVATNRRPILIVSEYSDYDGLVEFDLLSERVFRVLVDGIFIDAAEKELTKRSL